MTWPGNGAIGPFVLVYLHDARAFPLDTSGLVVALRPAREPRRGTRGRLAGRSTRRAHPPPSLARYGCARRRLAFAARPWQAALLLALSGAAASGFGTSQSTPRAAFTAPGPASNRVRAPACQHQPRPRARRSRRRVRGEYRATDELRAPLLAERALVRRERGARAHTPPGASVPAHRRGGLQRRAAEPRVYGLLGSQHPPHRRCNRADGDVPFRSSR